MIAIRLAALFCVLGAARLWAGVALLVSEPFGKFGFFNPTGHASIYLTNICAETPVRLRPCQPGEHGVVLSRYHRIGGYDWIAIPLLPYLYAVEHAEEVPGSVNLNVVARLRNRYRQAALRELAPDTPGREIPEGDWVQLIGSSYDRVIYGFALDTTPEDDQRLIEYLNARPNRTRFHLLYRNCADFARSIVNFYFPHALRRSIVADAGISTPKHLAKSLVRYSRRRPNLQARCFSIAQVPGLPRSTRLRGVNESLIRSKKYVAPLLLVQPWAAASAGAAYLVAGRFNPSAQPHTVCEPANLLACATLSASAP